MIYEFECKYGHVSEAQVPVGTSWVICEACCNILDADQVVPMAKRIMSPTRTSFKFADTKLKA